MGLALAAARTPSGPSSIRRFLLLTTLVFSQALSLVTWSGRRAGEATVPVGCNYSHPACLLAGRSGGFCSGARRVAELLTFSPIDSTRARAGYPASRRVPALSSRLPFRPRLRRPHLRTPPLRTPCRWPDLRTPCRRPLDCPDHQRPPSGRPPLLPVGSQYVRPSSSVGPVLLRDPPAGLVMGVHVTFAVA